MKMKSYFAATVEAAMNAARLELGSEAMLVSTKRTADESRHLGEYEVIFAAAMPQEASPGIQMPAWAQPPKLQPLDKLSDEVAALKREMERLASALTRSTAGMAQIAGNAVLAEIFSRLLEAELDSEIARQLLSCLSLRLQNANADDCTDSVADELSKMIKVDSLITSTSGRNAIALVGPPGAGKTTTLVKLAVRYGLATRRPSHILSVDTHRVGAAESLRSYAAIMGIGFRALETPRSLWQALEECRAKDLVLIDTPGLGSADLEDAGEIARMISKHAKIDTHLVLSAAMKSADLKRAALRYEMFAPARLIFTHLDETETFGPLVSLSVRTGKPVSFLARGQQIPEDLEQADSLTLANLVIQGTRTAVIEKRSRAAA